MLELSTLICGLCNAGERFGRRDPEPDHDQQDQLRRGERAGQGLGKSGPRVPFCTPSELSHP